MMTSAASRTNWSWARPSWIATRTARTLWWPRNGRPRELSCPQLRYFIPEPYKQYSSTLIKLILKRITKQNEN